ncbi:MAG: OmpA family protein [Chitinophagales bacterium]|nr:OmpA family protein [Chitinophagales bacterium]MDW8394325.1 OmpA family protein [Chitinophagales bacterium]
MEKPTGITGVTIALGLSLASCLITQQPKTGEILFQEKNYAWAAQKLQQEFAAATELPAKANLAFLIAESYRLSAQFEEAEAWYQRALSLDADQRTEFLYASMLKANEKYDEASAAFSRYTDRYPFDDRGHSEVEACQLAAQWKKNPLPVTVVPVSALNSPAFDYAPVRYRNGALVFTSDRDLATGEEAYGWTGKKFSDLFTSAPDGAGSWQTPQPFSALINSPFNEGAATFSPDFQQCYFTRCGSNATTTDFCQILTCIWNGSEWSEPQVLPLLNDTCNVMHPFLSADGKELFVSSDAEGGYGGKDLYVFFRQADGSWGSPQNLGPAVNTEGDELFPHLGPDQRLYFASNGHPGMGGFDLFAAARLGRQWGNVQNLKAPINSGADDLALILEPLNPREKRLLVRKGYFASNRPGGKGNDDIYAFQEEKQKTFLLVAQVVEKQFAQAGNPNSEVIGFLPLAGQPVQIQELSVQGQPSGNPVTLTTDADGRVTLITEPLKQFRLAASRPDYFTRTENAAMPAREDTDEDTVLVSVRLVLDRIFRNVEINIPNIYYDYDKATIRSDARPVLDTLAVLLNDNPQVSVEIGSHTDARGSATYNQRLSQARAQSVVNYLIEKGISPERLSAKGYGESQPVNRCRDGVTCTEEEHQQNRRTTFKVTAVRPAPEAEQ